jgi:hypothetical protein
MTAKSLAQGRRNEPSSCTKHNLSWLSFLPANLLLGRSAVKQWSGSVLPKARYPASGERKRRRRRELETTKTEENAIAPPAISGFRSPAAASGRAATL